MSGWGFAIMLYPAWRDAVTKFNIDQQRVNNLIESHGRMWLDICGYDVIYDPDNCGFDKDEDKEPGPEARPMYQPNLDLRVAWGEWGPEHITVPGNACGLDLDSGISAPIDGKSLAPHNVDCMKQAYLLQLVFSWFGNAIALNLEYQDDKS